VSGWGDFAVLMGAATASLLGLLFVAVSIRVEPIAKSAELRNRSAHTMTLLLTGLLAAALLAVPDQRRWALGILVGPERDAAFAAIVAEAPSARQFQEQTGRIIPVVELEPDDRENDRTPWPQ
jgi:hypothetical protein